MFSVFLNFASLEKLVQQLVDVESHNGLSGISSSFATFQLPCSLSPENCWQARVGPLSGGSSRSCPVSRSVQSSVTSGLLTCRSGQRALALLPQGRPPRAGPGSPAPTQGCLDLCLAPREFQLHVRDLMP